MHAKITKLGRALGVTLYERVGRRLVLIPAGHRLAALARDTSARVGEYLAERDAANAPITLAAAAVAPLAWSIVDFEDIEHLRRHSPAWRLLRADNAPLVLSFLGRVFVEDNARSLPLGRLIELLDDELFALNGRLGEGTFPKAAKSYLDDWAAPTSGWLRVYYPAGSDEAHVDATPAVEKALAWVESARTRSFVGTESRLQTAFELLRQMAYGTEPDDAVRLEELARRRAEIDREIARVEAGEQPPLDTTALRDRYQQFSDTARGLLEVGS